MIKVMIADDHPLVREGLKSMLDTPGIQLVGEAESGTELLQLLPEVEADLVLMDISMPEMDGLEATRHLQQYFPHIKVLILSIMDNERFVADALKAGALGYLLKTINRKELIRAIQVVAEGEVYIATQITMKMLEKMQSNHRNALPLEEKEEGGISKRELEVLRLIAQGYTTTQMADTLFTSKRTVESHRMHLLEKTSSKNTAALIAYAATHQLLN